MKCEVCGGLEAADEACGPSRAMVEGAAGLVTSGPGVIHEVVRGVVRPTRDIGSGGGVRGP